MRTGGYALFYRGSFLRPQMTRFLSPLPSGAYS